MPGVSSLTFMSSDSHMSSRLSLAPLWDNTKANLQFPHLHELKLLGSAVACALAQVKKLAEQRPGAITSLTVFPPLTDEDAQALESLRDSVQNVHVRVKRFIAG